MNIIGLSALVGSYDNYIWVLHNDRFAWVVDPGQAEQVSNYLSKHQLTLDGILITHHHFDHVGGIAALKQQYPQCRVYGSLLTENPLIEVRVSEGDSIDLSGMATLNVLETPGHTPDHISYYAENIGLFCADTLFTAGCGRLLGGTPKQFADTLCRLRDLPDETAFYCAHEYTADNLAFALFVDSDNAALQQRKAIFSTEYPALQQGPLGNLKLEKETNPFLRFDKEPIRSQLITKGASTEAESLFKTLRDWKDQFDRQQ